MSRSGHFSNDDKRQQTDKINNYCFTPCACMQLRVIIIPLSMFEMTDQISMHLQLFHQMHQFHQSPATVDSHFQSLDNKQHVHPLQQAKAVLSFFSTQLQPGIKVGTGSSYNHAQYHGIVHGSMWMFIEIKHMQHKDVWHCSRLSDWELCKL